MGAVFAEGNAGGSVDLDIPGGKLIAITEKSRVAMTTVAAILDRPSRITSLRSARGDVIIRVASIIVDLSYVGVPGAHRIWRNSEVDRSSPRPVTKQTLCQCLKSA